MFVRIFQLSLLGFSFLFTPSASIAESKQTECINGEVVLVRKWRNEGATNSEIQEVSSLLNIKKSKGNLIVANDYSSISRAGLDSPGFCPSIEKICRNFFRKAKRKGIKSFLKTKNLSCSYNQIIRVSKKPDDPNYSSLIGFNNSSDYDIDAPEAWNLSTGSESVVVGVIDTGVDYNHIDLADNIWTNPDEIPGDGIDNDSNGYIDDVHGINAILGTGDPMDDNGHGTHCSGTIGAVGNNSVGVVGVNWNVRIIGAKFLDSEGGGTLGDAILALNYLTNLKVNKGVHIVATNNSWGGDSESYALTTAIKNSVNAGILFVAAAGNDSLDNDVSSSYPANTDSEGVITVGALNPYDGNLAYFSNYGENSVDIAAPGYNILSTVPGNSYAYYSGTSMATPHVTGVLALISSVNTDFTSSDLKNILLSQAESYSSLSGLVSGGRVLKAAAALSYATGREPSDSDEDSEYAPNTPLSIKVRVYTNGKAKISWTEDESGELADSFIVDIYKKGTDSLLFEKEVSFENSFVKTTKLKRSNYTAYVRATNSFGSSESITKNFRIRITKSKSTR